MEESLHHLLVAVKGAGDLATGVMHRLARAGFSVVATELPYPTVVRRTVAFAGAITTGQMTVEGITAQRVESLSGIHIALALGHIPVLIDPEGQLLKQLAPTILVEATLSKRNTGISIHDAPIVIALGPGYEAGIDAHAVIETNRGHNLGRVYLSGTAEPNTGIPGPIGGYTLERLLRAPSAGTLYATRQIGDIIQIHETVALIKTATGESAPVISAISGVLRGLVSDGLPVFTGMKVGDVDPRATREHCFTISDKSRAIGGGVLEAILYLLQDRHSHQISENQAMKE